MTRKRRIPENHEDSHQKQPRYQENREEKHDEQGEGGEHAGKGEFPVTLVRYLEQMAKEKPTGEMLEIFAEKCLEEVEGQEEHLLHFVDGCLAVEAVFTKSAEAAFEYLKRLQRYKKNQRIQLMYTRSAERVIERLILTMVPFQDEHEEIISAWIDLLIENWNDVISDQACSFLIRAIAKALCGINPQLAANKSIQDALKSLDKKKLPKGWIRQELEKLYLRAFDYNSMQAMLVIQPVSLILQDFAALERRAQTGHVQTFVAKFIEDDKNLLDSFSNRASSRLWEQLIANVDEQIHESLFVGFISDHFKVLATHPTANYPLKTFLSSTKSEEIASEVSTLFLEILPDLIDQNKLWIVSPALKLIANFAELQEDVVKNLRKLFKSSKKENRTHFLPNVVCLNDSEIEEADGKIEFNVEKAKVNGSLILTQLFHFKKNQTLLASLNSLKESTLNSLTESAVGSHVFDGFFASKNIDVSVKIELFEKLNPGKLIKDKYGSRIFEHFWFETELSPEYRENLIKNLFTPLLTSTVSRHF
uniref:Nucleolar protein 9 n=1 Tax=Bursaphelenchus xylophilus TaxID=6326 RepID=A0A1I7RU32_BURXY